MPPRGSERPTLASVVAANPDTFAKLTRYSVALFGLSLGSFLLLSSARLGVGARITGLEAQGPRDVVAAIVGVTVAWLVIAAYVVDAWHEPDEAPLPLPLPPRRAAAAAAPAEAAPAAKAAAEAPLRAADEDDGVSRATDMRRRGTRS
jgi:hypothetical protein